MRSRPPSLRPPPGRPARRWLASGLAAAVLAVAGCRDDTRADTSPDASPDASPVARTDDRRPAAPATTAADDTDARPAEEGQWPLEVHTDADLYAIPEPLPEAPHGTLLKYQRVPDLVADAQSYRVLYLSRALAGEAVAVSGLVVVPTAPAPGTGRVVLAAAHGTTGVADRCAPSTTPTASEARLIAGGATRYGWITAATDYEGLGTPGRHPYLVGPSEGRSVLDSVLAAQQLPGSAASDTVVMAGYSQGGHAALWANQLRAEWAPELDVAGVFAGAPASDVDLALRAGAIAPIGGFVLAIVAGYEAAYPEADPSLLLTERGQAVLAAVDEGCIVDLFTAARSVAPDALVRPDLDGAEVWFDLGRRNSPGQVRADSPVLIVHSEQDDLVPARLSAATFDRMCAVGQVVERRVLPDGGGHVAAVMPAYLQGMAWLKALVDGTEAAQDDCPRSGS